LTQIGENAGRENNGPNCSQLTKRWLPAKGFTSKLLE